MLIDPRFPATVSGDGRRTAIGVQNNVWRSGNWNPGRATPTITNGRPSTFTPRPTIAGSALKRSRQPRSLSTRKPSAPAAPSSG